MTVFLQAEQLGENIILCHDQVIQRARIQRVVSELAYANTALKEFKTPPWHYLQIPLEE